ncbi:MAG: hypothetical protein H7Z75_08015 [Ferruginibacter sp.]|nr:hypothetical protein [Cytophagales bacterium]
MVALGASALLVVGLMLTKVLTISPVYYGNGLLLAATVWMLAVIYRMVVTGRVKAKGAKRRRRELLPLFYEKRHGTENQRSE